MTLVVPSTPRLNLNLLPLNWDVAGGEQPSRQVGFIVFPMELVADSRGEAAESRATVLLTSTRSL